MDSCTCDGPGFCERWGRDVTRMGHSACKKGTERGLAMYFGEGRQPRRRIERSVEAARTAGEACAYLGGPVVGEDGRQLTKRCGPCGGKVSLKVFACEHPGHGANPTTTVGKTGECQRCQDFTAREPEVVQVTSDPVVNYWRGGA